MGREADRLRDLLQQAQLAIKQLTHPEADSPQKQQHSLKNSGAGKSVSVGTEANKSGGVVVNKQAVEVISEGEPVAAAGYEEAAEQAQWLTDAMDSFEALQQEMRTSTPRATNNNKPTEETKQEARLARSRSMNQEEEHEEEWAATHTPEPASSDTAHAAQTQEQVQEEEQQLELLVAQRETAEAEAAVQQARSEAAEAIHIAEQLQGQLEHAQRQFE